MKRLKSPASVSFFTQADTYFKSLRENGKYNSLQADMPRVKRFREFLKGEDIRFQEINPALLHRFQSYLRNRTLKDKTKPTATIQERTVVNHLIVIRTIFNQAIRSGAAEAKHYPFSRDGIKIKFPDTLKIGLTDEEVRKIEELYLEPDSMLNHVRNEWLFSFYFAGVRISDVLRMKWGDFQNERLYYTMGKNAKGGSLKVSAKAQEILKQYYRDNPAHDLVFP